VVPPVSTVCPTALIADDEPLLRTALRRQLGKAWPELEVVAQARNGREAVALFEEHRPDICFLDVHMPGLSGVEAARRIGRNAHLVFVTAYDAYAVQAFEHGVLDYLVKPVELARLAETVVRLKERLQKAQPAADTEALINELAERLQIKPRAAPLRFIRANVGKALRLIPVEAIDFLRSDEKYTRVCWRSDEGQFHQALIRVPLKDLLAQLDRQQFVQVHRSVVVNLRSVSHVSRNENETGCIHLKDRKEVLPVSRTYLHLFRQM
jgi:DNA-binding LytR/AlgR family response regulator